MGQNCWFPTIIRKRIHTIQFKLVVYTCWVSFQNLFTFGPRWLNFGPLMATEWLKMEVSDAIQFKFGVYTYWVSVQNWFTFGPRWPNFGPHGAWKWVKMLPSDHYQKKCSCNPIQTFCVHLLGECLELIRFWATLAQFRPSCDHKMTLNWWFLTVIWKKFHTIQFKRRWKHRWAAYKSFD